MSRHNICGTIMRLAYAAEHPSMSRPFFVNVYRSANPHGLDHYGRPRWSRQEASEKSILAAGRLAYRIRVIPKGATREDDPR